MNWRCVRSDYVTPADVVMQWQQPLERWSSNNVVKKWAIIVFGTSFLKVMVAVSQILLLFIA